MRRLRVRAELMMCLAFLACSTALSNHQTRVQETSDLLTLNELETVSGTTQNAYSAVERLRPLFLVTRPGSGSVGGRQAHIYVFVQDNLVGDIDALRTIPVASIKSIQRVQAMTSFTRYADVQAGDSVLLVRLR